MIQFKLTNRDLAARNCLIHKTPGSNEITLKLADFGLSKYGVSIYGLKPTSILPAKWSAIEALTKSNAKPLNY